MKSDIQIAQKTKLKPISEIAEKAGIKRSELELYGDFKAKITARLWKRLAREKDGKLILVTATSPTPLGEGKTTTSVGLAMAMNRLGKKAVLALREPSVGPCMGMKGGATGGGFSQVVPMEDINLHFTGDIHAMTAANNLLSALIDNHLYHGNALRLDPERIAWKRCLDLNDRALRHVTVDLSRKNDDKSRQDNFNITVASEIMAIMCLAENIADLKKRLAKIIVAYDVDGKAIFAKDLKAAGVMAALLKDALKPNLVQTLEHTPVLIHGGPFANIAHGCNSVLATRYGLKLGDYLITEAGFGADLGAEKFFDIKCRAAGLKPSAVVIVTTIRSLKYNGGADLKNITRENLAELKKGAVNLEKHLENLEKFGVPVVVAINAFPKDTPREIKLVLSLCESRNVPASVSHVWEKGSRGGTDLAEKLLDTLKTKPAKFKLLYGTKKSLREKIAIISKEIYGAKTVNYSREAQKQLKELADGGFNSLPVCIAKTQYSFSDDPKLLGRPQNFNLNISQLRLSNGAGFIVALSGNIMTMPGLPKIPAAEKIDVDGQGVIAGLF